MYAGEFFTWSRALHVEIISSRIPAHELRDRTLNLVYIDRDKNFDHIEWELDNRDGELTKLEHLAVGMMIKIRIGYEGSAFPWKAFIINRVRGGVGVQGKDRPAVGDTGSKVTYYGRNRNAPGGRVSKPWKRSASPAPKKAKKSYPATTSVTKHEMLLKALTDPRIIPATTTSEAVEKVAKRNGFEASFAIVEPTLDPIESGVVAIPDGMSDAQWLAKMAKAGGRDFIFKIDDRGLHWHSRYFPGGLEQPADYLVYGETPDITSLEMDCDFSLPVPLKVKNHGYSWVKRAGHFQEVEFDKAQRRLNMSTVYGSFFDDPEVKKALTRTEISYSPGSDVPTKTETRAYQRFLRRHTKAFQINVTTVGNPKLLAARLVSIRGTGNKIIDRAFYISEARHTVSGTTYITELKLKHPPKRYPGAIDVGHFQESDYDKAQRRLNMSTTYYKGWNFRQRKPGLRE